MAVIEAAADKVMKEGPEGEGEIHGFANPNTKISIFFFQSVVHEYRTSMLQHTDWI